MADAVSFYRAVINTVTQFEAVLEQLSLIADRMAADGTLAAAAAGAAVATGRTDLSTVDFTNCQAAIAAIQAAHTGNVKAFFYKML